MRSNSLHHIQMTLFKLMYGQFSIGGKGLKNFIQIESNKLTMALVKDSA